MGCWLFVFPSHVRPFPGSSVRVRRGNAAIAACGPASPFALELLRALGPRADAVPGDPNENLKQAVRWI